MRGKQKTGKGTYRVIRCHRLFGEDVRGGSDMA
jgi:hypothetical protein